MTAAEDWQEFADVAIQKQAERLWMLVSHKRAPRRIEFLSILAFLLGALHELMRASKYGFAYKPNQRPELKPILNRSEQLALGKWRRDGTWMAGLHFNSALVRLAAVHDRSLKLVVGKGIKDDDRITDLRRKAAQFYWEHTPKQWVARTSRGSTER